MKNVKLVLVAVALILIGAFVGYKILENGNDFVETVEQQLQKKSIKELASLYKTEDKRENKEMILRVMGTKHLITEAQYNLYSDFFWTGSVVEIDYNKTKLEEIYGLYNPISNIDWIEFKPTNHQVNDITYSPVNTFKQTTSCYFIPLFLGMKNIMLDNGYDVLHVTKGANYISEGGEKPKLYTIILFRLVRKDQPDLYYNISTDPGP